MDDWYDRQKFAELLLYAAAKLKNDPLGGATKLNKVLFFAEMEHFRLHGRPISGCRFQKLEHGPAPRHLLPVRQQLVEAGAATLESETIGNRSLDRLVPRRPADVSLFSPDELESIDRTVERLRGLTATQVSDLSHKHPGWRLTDEGDDIPLASALLDTPQISTPAIRRVAAEISQRYGLTPSA